MVKAIQRFLTISLLLAGALYLLFQAYLYNSARELFPPQTTIAGLDVGGLTSAEAVDLLQNHYLSPVAVYHRQERVELNPQDVGFRLDVDAMVNEATAQMAQETFWQGYVEFLLGRSLEPVAISLQATHDREALVEWLRIVAGYLDEPAKSPQLVRDSGTFREGEPGFVTDVEASLPALEEALYAQEEREVQLVVVEQEVPPLDINLLAATIERQLEEFNGIGSVFLLDLQTGEEVNINADIALSGLSVLKIAVFVEAYRALDGPPNEYQQELFYDTAVRSSDYGANLLLHIVAGQDNTYLGTDILTESMRRLGLENTFMAVPYNAVAPPHRPSTYVTPANSRTDITTQPDPSIQSTAEDVGTLLSMIYYCAKGGGALLAVYPDQITPEECQAIIDLMVLNEEGNLIRAGVPPGTPVSHKHGWDAYGTHADAGLVFTPGGDYVLVEFLHRPGGGWVDIEESFPVLRGISRTVYNYFNVENPYLGETAAQQNEIDLDAPAFQESAVTGPDEQQVK